MISDDDDDDDADEPQADDSATRLVQANEQAAHAARTTQSPGLGMVRVRVRTRRLGGEGPRLHTSCNATATAIPIR